MCGLTEAVEDPCDPDVDSILARVAVREGFGDSLPFVVTCSRTIRVDVSPIRLGLRMYLGRTVDLCTHPESTSSQRDGS